MDHKDETEIGAINSVMRATAVEVLHDALAYLTRNPNGTGASQPPVPSIGKVVIEFDALLNTLRVTVSVTGEAT